MMTNLTNPTPGLGRGISKSDIDRIKQRAGSRKIALAKIRAALVAVKQGMSEKAFVEEVEKVMRVVK